MVVVVMVVVVVVVVIVAVRLLLEQVLKVLVHFAKQLFEVSRITLRRIRDLIAELSQMSD